MGLSTMWSSSTMDIIRTEIIKLVPVVSGSNFAQLSSELKTKHRTDQSLMAFAQEYNLPYQRIVQNTYLCDEARAFAFQARAGTDIIPQLLGRKVVLSNAPVEFVHLVLARLGMLEWFGQVISITLKHRPLHARSDPTFRPLLKGVGLFSLAIPPRQEPSVESIPCRPPVLIPKKHWKRPINNWPDL